MPVLSKVSTATYTEQKLGGLTSALASLLPEGAGNANTLAEILLHHPSVDGDDEYPQSDLNVTGSPLQLLLSAKHSHWDARLIGDPAFYEADPLVRLQKSLVALDEMLSIANAVDLRDIILRSISSVVPADHESRRRYPTGMIRLAAALSTPGIAVYVGAPYVSNRWDVARHWLTSMLNSPDQALTTIDCLEPNTAVFGMGIEGASPTQLRAKIYWRLENPSPIASLGLPLLSSPAMNHFLGAVLGEMNIPANALTFSAAFDVSNGILHDVKADICIANTNLGLQDVLYCVNDQASFLGLAPPVLERCSDVLERNNVDIGCLGLGADIYGKYRINAYLHQRSPVPEIP